MFLIEWPQASRTTYHCVSINPPDYKFKIFHTKLSIHFTKGGGGAEQSLCHSYSSYVNVHNISSRDFETMQRNPIYHL